METVACSDPGGPYPPGHQLPVHRPGRRAHIARTLAQAYVSARLADLPVALARESSGIASGIQSDARLYIAPSVKQVLAWSSHACKHLTVKPVLAAGREFTTLDDEDTAEGVTIGPFGVNVFKVIGSGTTGAGQ